MFIAPRLRRRGYLDSWRNPDYTGASDRQDTDERLVALGLLTPVRPQIRDLAAGFIERFRQLFRG